jgi:ABC-type uncharacterized transport system auxiliary subunit
MQRSVRCLMSLVLIIAFMLMLVGCGEKPVSKEGKDLDSREHVTRMGINPHKYWKVTSLCVFIITMVF